MSQTRSALAFKPGDVVFYKTTEDGEPKPSFDKLARRSLSDFHVMAALAQTLPYQLTDGRYRPWYHVALCVEGGTEPLLVGFESNSIEDGDLGHVQTYRLGTGPEHPVRLPDQVNETGVGVEVLRPPGSVDVDGCVSDALRQAEAETPYSVVGLIAFAMATNAWMIIDGPEREALLAEALGAEQVARGLDAREATAESCVTSVARALGAGGVALEIAPPPTPSEPPDAGSHFELKVMKAALDRLLSGRLGSASLDASSLFGSDKRAAVELLSVYHRYLRAVGHDTAALNSDEFAASPLGQMLVPIIRMSVAFNYGDLANVYQLVSADPLPEGTPPFAIKVGLTYAYKPDQDDFPYISLDLEDIETDPEAIPNRREPSTGISGPDRLSPVQYLATLADTFRVHFGGITRAELQSTGRARLGQPLDATNLIVSPAMLWEALKRSGFIEVRP